jgi:hypothetical protein
VNEEVWGSYTNKYGKGRRIVGCDACNVAEFYQHCRKCTTSILRDEEYLETRDVPFLCNLCKLFPDYKVLSNRRTSELLL